MLKGEQYGRMATQVAKLPKNNKAVGSGRFKSIR